MRRAVILAAVLLAAACERGPEAPTAAQNDQLDEAANMLDAMGNEEGPEADAPGPSNDS